MAPKDQMIAAATAAQAQIIQSSTNTLVFSILLILGILAIALLAAVLISSTLTSPLVALTHTAQEITQGNLEARAKISSLKRNRHPRQRTQHHDGLPEGQHPIPGRAREGENLRTRRSLPKRQTGALLNSKGSS